MYQFIDYKDVLNKKLLSKLIEHVIVHMSTCGCLKMNTQMHGIDFCFGSTHCYFR